MRFLVPSHTTSWYTKLSTTTNPKSDWCGFPEGPVRGVVDLELEDESGRVVGLGEGLYQLLYAMQCHTNRSGHWPVGFVATKSDLQLMEPLERSGHILVTLTSFTTTRIDHLLSVVEQLVRIIDTQHVIAATESLTPSSEERLEAMEKRLEVIDQRLEVIDQRLEVIDQTQERGEETLATVVKGLDTPELLRKKILSGSKAAKIVRTRRRGDPVIRR
jgi:hypothetical protein